MNSPIFRAFLTSLFWSASLAAVSLHAEKGDAQVVSEPLSSFAEETLHRSIAHLPEALSIFSPESLRLHLLSYAHQKKSLTRALAPQGQLKNHYSDAELDTIHTRVIAHQALLQHTQRALFTAGQSIGANQKAGATRTLSAQYSFTRMQNLAHMLVSESQNTIGTHETHALWQEAVRGYLSTLPSDLQMSQQKALHTLGKELKKTTQLASKNAHTKTF